MSNMIPDHPFVLIRMLRDASHDVGLISGKSSKDEFDKALEKSKAVFGQLQAAIAKLSEENIRMKDLLNSPHTSDFLTGVRLEAAHQVQRWGSAHDGGKDGPDWFWLIGYLAGKALRASIEGDADKAKHHCISTAAVLLNWHAHISGVQTEFRPGLGPDRQETKPAAPTMGDGGVSQLEATAESLRVHIQPSARSYFLQNGVVGNTACFWRLNSRGYSSNINEAQMFTREQAFQQQAARASDIPWPVDYILGKATMTVDVTQISRQEAFPDE